MSLLKFLKGKINLKQANNSIENIEKIKISVFDKFDEVFKKIYEILKPLGYKKDGLNFRVYQEDGLCKMINIQKSQFSSKESLVFYINIGIYLEKEEVISNPKFKIYDCILDRRIGGNNSIWSIDETTDINKLFACVKESLEEIFEIFQEFDSREKTIQLILSNKTQKYFHPKTMKHNTIAKLLEDMGCSNEVYLTHYVSNNDNIITKIKQKDKEYNIQIELWDAKIVNVETVNCDSLIQYEAIGCEIGDINIETYENKFKYSFKDVWDNNRVILEIIADKLLIKENFNLETFGNLIVKINDQQIPYKSSVEHCIIGQKDEVYAEINKIEIETKNLKIKDKIDIIFDSKNNFKFYSSDEHTLMIYSKKQNSLCVFVGSDTDYSFEEAKFYNGENYCYALKKHDEQGFHYEIVENPSEHLNWDKGHIIELWFAILPINSDEDIEQKLLDFFIGHA